MSKIKEIIFATGNKAKLEQIKFIINYYNFDMKIIPGKELYGHKADYEETASTTEKIVKLGAIKVAKALNKPVIVEDTDFRINALNGFPNVKAGRFLTLFSREGILEMMDKIEDRKASITSSVALAYPNGEVYIFNNTIKGKVTREEKYGDFPHWISPITHPFGGGFNAIFIPDGHDGKTLAEISPEDSCPWSYREKNLKEVLEFLLKETS